MVEWGGEGPDLSDALSWLKKNPDRIGDFLGDVAEGAGDAAGDVLSGLVRAIDAIKAGDVRLMHLPDASDVTSFLSRRDSGKSTGVRSGEDPDLDRPEEVEAKARRLLQSAGVHPDMIDNLIGLGAAQAIVDQPSIVQGIAAQNPAVELSQYQQARTAYGFDSELTVDTFTGAGGPDALARNALVKKGYRTNESGALFFENGVIADPTSGQVFFPSRGDAPGSPVWLSEIQEKWNDRKVNEWRKRLADYGYDVAKEGPFDQMLLAALREYHEARYLNGGKPLPVDASLAGKSGADRIFDPAEVRNAVRMKFRTDWGDDPSEAELESWTQFTMSMAKRLVNKKGYEPAQAAVAAEERFVEKFESDPKLKFFQEAEEENTELRDSLLGTLQAINSAAR